MNKLNNLLTREEYIKSVNEGKIGNFLRKGVNKIKEIFSLFAKKIKNLIVLFDTNGNILPVMTPQAIGDHFASGNGDIEFCGTVDMNKEIQALGGKGCETKPKPVVEKDDDSPNGVFAYYDWTEKDYPNSTLYRNLQSLRQKLEESRSTFLSKEDLLNERMDTKDRAPYLRKNIEGMKNKVTSMNVEKFKKALNERIKKYCSDEQYEDDDDEFFKNAGDTRPNNFIVFGAPGIGKSTIPLSVVEEYNEGKSTKDRISLIKVNCANVKPGDLLMPNFPTPKDILDYLDTNETEFENLSFLDKYSEEEKKELKKKLEKSGQFTASNAPAPWVPCYKYTNDERLNDILDEAANGGRLSTGKKIWRINSVNGKRKKVDEIYQTGSGGIILLDEYLRAPKEVFDELLNFLLDREVSGWRLGSKWFIVACSNRPVDDGIVDEVWGSWYGAQQDRFAEFWHLDPNPEQWKNWALKKGFDETLLRFIFEESSKTSDGEYPRWHSVIQGTAAKDDDNKQITPRNWMAIHNKFVEFWKEHRHEERFKDGYSISNMDFDEIEELLEGVTDESFRSEIINWLKDHCGALSLDKILEDPINTIMPISSRTNEATILTTLTDDIKFRHSKKAFTDEEFSNVMIWLGKNYAKHFNIVATSFANHFKYMFDGKIGFWDFHKSGLLFMAAFPEPDYMEVVNYPGLKEALSDENHAKGYTDFFIDKNDENSLLDTVKDFAKQYFPWNIKNDELLSIYEVGILPDDEDKSKEKEETE